MCAFFFQAATKKQKYEKISEKKMSTPVDSLCKVKTVSLYPNNTILSSLLKLFNIKIELVH